MDLIFFNITWIILVKLKMSSKAEAERFNSFIKLDCFREIIVLFQCKSVIINTFT